PGPPRPRPRRLPGGWPGRRRPGPGTGRALRPLGGRPRAGPRRKPAPSLLLAPAAFALGFFLPDLAAAIGDDPPRWGDRLAHPPVRVQPVIPPLPPRHDGIIPGPR